jgi:hypothetical protein
LHGWRIIRTVLRFRSLPFRAIRDAPVSGTNRPHHAHDSMEIPSPWRSQLIAQSDCVVSATCKRPANIRRERKISHRVTALPRCLWRSRRMPGNKRKKRALEESFLRRSFPAPIANVKMESRLSAASVDSTENDDDYV